MDKRAKLVYDSLLLCEQIRLEFDGKRTLVGVFTSHAIGVPLLPYQVGLALYASGLVEEAGLFRTILSVKDSDGNILFTGDAGETAGLKIGRFNQDLAAAFEITKPTTLEITIFDLDRPVATTHRPVIYNPLHADNVVRDSV